MIVFFYIAQGINTFLLSLCYRSHQNQQSQDVLSVGKTPGN